MFDLFNNEELVELISHDINSAHAAFSILDARVRIHLKKYIKRFKLQPHIEADDLMQETLAKLWVQCIGSNPPKNPIAWCKSVLKNHILDMNKTNDSKREELDFDIITEHTPLEDMFLQDLLNSVSGVICSLSNKDLEAWNAYDSGLDGPEAAEKLGIAQSAYRKRLHSAKSKFRSALSQLDSD